MGFLYEFKDSEKVVLLKDGDVPEAENPSGLSSAYIQLLHTY